MPILSRRTLLASLAAGALQGGEAVDDFQTPYKLGKLVLGPSGEADSFDRKSVDCPFVFSHDGRFYMTYVGFDGTGYQTGLASSPDLITWKREGCILRRDPASKVTRYNVAMTWILRETAMRSQGAVTKVDGHFVGAYHAYPNAGYEDGPAVIGLCRSGDLHTWSVDEPCLNPEDGAAWERGGLYKPCLLKQGGTYYLFYNAKTEGKNWREQIGVATSPDLKTWKRYADNPLVSNGGPRSLDERFASDPCVVTDRGRWAMFYYSLDAKGKARDLLAIGRDPFHFVKADRILIDVGPPGAVDSVYAHKPSVFFHGGALYHYYCAVSGKYPDETRGIAVARSTRW